MQDKKRGTVFFCSVLTFCNLCGRNDRYRCSFNIYSNCLCQRFHAPFLTHPQKHLSFHCYLWDCLPYFCILNYSFFLFILPFNIHREQNDTFSLLILLLHFPPSLSLSSLFLVVHPRFMLLFISTLPSFYSRGRPRSSLPSHSFQFCPWFLFCFMVWVRLLLFYLSFSLLSLPDLSNIPERPQKVFPCLAVVLDAERIWW